MPLIVFLFSFIIAVLIFLFNKKEYNSVLSLISIIINTYFIANYGLFYTFPVSSNIGSFGFVVNPLNLAFIITIILVTSTTVIYSLRYMEKRFEELGGGSWRIYYGLYTLFAISMLYTVISTNLLEAYIFIEIALVTSFGLILLYGYGDRRRISLLYFIWTHVGTITTLASIIIIGLQSGVMDIYRDAFSFNNYGNLQYSPLIFLLGVIGMFVKGALAGFNIWLPYAHGEAPTPISVLLSPNMVGLGVFISIIYFYLFPSLSYLGPIFLFWALITMIYGGINAIAQRDFKRFLAYSSVSQMGYMLLGSVISFIVGLNNTIYELPLGVLASVLIYVSHGFGKALLFMSAGAAITELHERDIEKLGGLYLTSPLHTTLSFIGILNLLGLPPTVGLISEVLLLFSAGQLVNNIYLFLPTIILLFIAIGISAGYASYLFKKVYAGVKNLKINDRIEEYTIPMLILSAFSIFFFFYPNVLTNFLPLTIISESNYFIPSLVALLPMLGSLLALVLPRNHQDLRGAIVTALIGLSVVFSIYNLIYTLSSASITEFFKPLITFTLFSYFTFSTSPLQAILSLFVSTLSFFISLYSIGYMKEDKVLRRYWSLFGLFVSSMLLVVLSDNIILFMAGWEGTGLASYALISYWLDDNEKNVVGDFKRIIFGFEYVSRPTTSGIRALVFTRVGDVGLLVGLGYLLYIESGFTGYVIQNSLEIYNHLFPSLVNGYNLSYFWLILILTALGGLAKSAQFPFTQWLLTAMTGPTPVSALIHAATMVNLGAIFTFIIYPFLKYPDPQTYLFLSFMVSVSLFTGIYTSLSALGANEQKVILAYSTADQISLMIFSSSLGGILQLVFGGEILFLGILVGLTQMVAHGIYKASLFMNTGSVIHVTESRYLGHKVYRKMPLITILQAIASLNLANIPFTMGYLAHSLIGDISLNLSIIFWIYIIIEFLGAIYIIRYFVKTFIWKYGDEPHEAHVHPTMVISPLILVVSSLILGIYTLPIHNLFKIFNLEVPLFSINLVEVSISLLGILLALIIYLRGIEIGRYLSSLSNFLYYGWYVNPALDKFGYSSFSTFKFIFNNFETGIIDNTLNIALPTAIINVGSKLVTTFQTGILRNYIGIYIIGLILLLVIFILIGVL